MRKPDKIPIEKYDYPLPDDRIAKYPLADRDASKVLVYRPGSLEQKQFSQVPELLEKSDRLYFNATRVVQARLIFRKSTGARIEIFCLEPFLPADHQLAFSSTGPVEFICLIGNSKKWKEGKLTKKLGEHKIFGKEKGKVAEGMGTSEDGEENATFELLTSGDGADNVTGAPGISKEVRGESTGELQSSYDVTDKAPGELLLTAEPAGRQDDKFIVRFSWNDPGLSFGEILERSGSTPIPPYLNREAEEQDAANYQTVYARQDGSVAAPTAGLHFTERVLDALDRKGVRRHELILHVGAGTFIPVKEENAVDHRMHAELVTADRSLLASLLSGDRKIAVGTTTTRSLESIYWLGVKAISSAHFTFENLFLDQWDAYEMEQGGKPARSLQSPMKKMDEAIPLETAVRTLLEKMDEAGLETFSFHTRLMITPGYRFRVIGGLFTNFHQPKSTLLLLIAAVAGDDWQKIYDFALENEFRFLSYGDSSLLFLQQAE